MATSTVAVLGELPSFASLTLCTICHEPYDTAARKPKLIPCGNGHSLCLHCVDRLLNGAGLAKCPTCQQMFSCPTGDANNLATNFELNRAIVEFKEILDRRSLGFATCCECQINGDEQGFRLCLECCAAKGSYCDPSREQFDLNTMLESLATCSGCILKNHNVPGHTIADFVPYRIRRDRGDITSWRVDISPRIDDLLSEVKDLPNLILDSDTLIKSMVSESEAADSSLVLKDIKDFVELEQLELCSAVRRMTNIAQKFNKELKNKHTNNLRKVAEFREHCKPVQKQIPVWQQSLHLMGDLARSGLVLLFHVVSALCYLAWITVTDRIARRIDSMRENRRQNQQKREAEEKEKVETSRNQKYPVNKEMDVDDAKVEVDYS